MIIEKKNNTRGSWPAALPVKKPTIDMVQPNK